MEVLGNKSPTNDANLDFSLSGDGYAAETGADKGLDVRVMTAEERLTCPVTAECLYGPMVSLTRLDGNSRA
ncbi:hypothetical protein WN48_03681 [Eufriesea mexicana]|nr:hypothetical protein WN48_03681 [Eufriesea mexicana]